MRYLIICLLFVLDAGAQYSTLGGKLEGESVINSIVSEGTALTHDVFSATATGVYELSAVGGILMVATRLLWSPPNGKKIVSFRRKTGPNAGGMDFLVLLDDGTRIVLYKVDNMYHQQLNKQGNLPGAPADGFKDFAGDDVYVLNTRGSSSLVWVSRDTGSALGTTWQLDTAGLIGFVRNIVLDTAQYVYAASYNGLFVQHPDTSVWRKSATMTTTDINAVFAGRGNRLAVANRFWGPGWKTGISISEDRGETWTADTAGLGFVLINAFGDDAAGNLYALGTNATNESRLYRRMGSTPGWTRIDQGITRLSLDTTRSVINTISGDTVLLASTSFGIFQSTDQGTTWKGPVQTRAESMNGLLRPSANRWVASTYMGLYYHDRGDTTAWAKSHPDTGYLGGFSLHEGGPGEILAHRFSSGPSTVLKSSDGGSTWSADTAGRKAIPGSHAAFYADEAGNQYNLNNTLQVFSKPSGGAWGPDSGWPTLTSGYCRAVGGDRAGNVFVTVDSGRVYRRAISGGAWSLDTALGIGTAYLQWIWPGRNGSLFATALAGPLYTRSGGRWSPIQNPTLPSGASSTRASAVLEDAGGALFVAYVGVYASLRGRGVWMTTDKGANWTKLGLDSVMVNGLVADGDTLYASTDRGIIALTRGGVVGIAKGKVPGSGSGWRLHPIQVKGPTLKVDFHLARTGEISLQVFDIRGRLVSTLFRGILEAGPHSLSRDIGQLPRGVQFCRLKARGFSQTRRFVTQR